MVSGLRYFCHYFVPMYHCTVLYIVLIIYYNKTNLTLKTLN